MVLVWKTPAKLLEMGLVDVQLWAHCALAYHIAEVTAPWDLAFILRAIGEALSQLLREHD